MTEHRRVLILSATPRHGGNSDILADQAAAGARAAGADVEKVRLADLRIDPCDACDACMGDGGGRCILDDDMQGLYPKLLQADAVVFATPIYFFSASAQMKCFLDRTYALGGLGDWTALAGKRVGLLMTYGDPNPRESGLDNALGMFRDACRFLRMDLAGCVHASCSDAGEVRSNAAAMRDAEELGRQVAARGGPQAS